MNNDYTFKPDHFIAIEPSALLRALSAFSGTADAAGRFVLYRYDCMYFARPCAEDSRVVLVHNDGSLEMPVNTKYDYFAKRVNAINLFKCDELMVDFNNGFVQCSILLARGRLTFGFEFDPMVTDMAAYDNFVKSIIEK